MNIVYVYAKDKKIKVLDHDIAVATNSEMLERGWKHTMTINACTWIERLYNNHTDDDVLLIVKDLGKQFI